MSVETGRFEARPRCLGRLLLALAPLVSACDILSPGEHRVGVIEHHDWVAEIDVPEVVQAGRSFRVSFYTFGGGCVTKGSTRVIAGGNVATVIPIDRDSGADVCTAELAFLDHSTSVRFDGVGSATVQVMGRRSPGGEEIVRSFVVSVE